MFGQGEGGGGWQLIGLDRANIRAMCLPLIRDKGCFIFIDLRIFTTIRCTVLKGPVSVMAAISVLNTYTRRTALLDTGTVKRMLA